MIEFFPSLQHCPPVPAAWLKTAGPQARPIDLGGVISSRSLDAGEGVGLIELSKARQPASGQPWCPGRGARVCR